MTDSSFSCAKITKEYDPKRLTFIKKGNQSRGSCHKTSCSFYRSLSLSTQAYTAQRVITVAHFGGDLSSPVDAANAIGTIYPPASVKNTHLIKVQLGTYLVNEPIKLKRYVFIAGTSRHLTKIRGDVSGTYRDSLGLWPFSADTQAASHSDIRYLSVTNKHEDSSNYVISARSVNDVIFQDLIVESTGRSNSSINWKTGFWIENSRKIKMTNLAVSMNPTKPGYKRPSYTT